MTKFEAAGIVLFLGGGFFGWAMARISKLSDARLDQMRDQHRQNAGDRLLTAVNDLGDQADHLWADQPTAEVIPGPWKPRSVA